MKCKSVFLLAAIFLWAVPAIAQKTGYFAKRALIGIDYGIDRDWEGERNNRYEISQSWGQRAGIW